MSNEMQHQTTVNIQEKANLIWAIADKLVGVYKPHEYGNVILPRPRQLECGGRVRNMTNKAR